ncbi:MAG: glycosyltransferase family 4 protein [Polyangia bacterium]
MSPGATVGVVTSSYPRREGDPAGSFVHGLARALVRRGHAVEVVAPEPETPPRWGPDEEWLAGVRVHGAPYARPRRLQRLFYRAGAPDNLAGEPWLAALAPVALAALFAETRRRISAWDAAIAHWLVPAGLAASAALPRGRSLRLLAVAHSADLHLLRVLPGGAGRAIAGYTADRAAAVGYVAETQRAELEALLGPRRFARLALTPMGIDLEELRPDRPAEEVRRELGVGKEHLSLFLGRLVPIKGADLLIEARANRRDAALVIAGDGPERSRLERLARRSRTRVLFTGEVGPRRRAELLAACDCFVLPSRDLPGGRREGLPLALLEALAAGRPVVASRSGGVEDLVGEGVSGLLVPPGDTARLDRAIDELAASPQLARRLAGAAKKEGARRDWSKLGKTYEDLLGIG